MQSRDWVAVAMIGVLAVIAVVALVAAVAFADGAEDKTGAITVAAACVATLGVLAGHLFKQLDDRNR
jgi:hypothetical protein